MKINAQELVLLNRRNLKNSESAPQTTPETTTVSNPESTMKALNLQGMNNISFQGVNTALVKKFGSKAAVLLTVLGGTLATQSCDKLAMPEPMKYPVEQPNDTTIIKIENNTNVETNVTIENNTDALIALLAQWMANQSAENAELRAQVAALLEELRALREDVNNGIADLSATQKALYEKQLEAFDLLKLQYANDVEQTQKIANLEARIEEIKALVESGQLKYSEAIDEVKKILESINGKLDGILGAIVDVQGHVRKLTDLGKLNEEQNANIIARLDDLTKLIETGQLEQAKAFIELYGISNDILNEMIINNKYNEKELAEIKVIQNQLANILIEVQLGNMDAQEGFDKISELLSKLSGQLDNITAMLQGELNKINTQLDMLVKLGQIDSKQDAKINEQIEELKALIANGQIQQAQALAGIYEIEKLILEQMIENNKYNGAFKEVLGQVEQDLTRIENAINNKEINVEVGTDEIESLIAKLSAQLEKIQASIDSLLKEVSSGFANLKAYAQAYDIKWANLMDMLKNYDGDLEELKAGQKDVKFFLNEQLKEIKSLKDLIKDLDITNGGNGSGNSGLTIEDLRAMFKELGDTYYNAFENFVKDNMPEATDTATIEKLLASIDKKLDNLQQPIDYSDDLANITSILEQLAARPDYSEKLDKIIELLEQFECNCNCGGSNEGIIGDLEDLLG